jgi:hypothetical protein
MTRPEGDCLPSSPSKCARPLQGFGSAFREGCVRARTHDVFANLELCRNFATQFKIDVTLLEDHHAFIDQP